MKNQNVNMIKIITVTTIVERINVYNVYIYEQEMLVNVITSQQLRQLKTTDCELIWEAHKCEINYYNTTSKYLVDVCVSLLPELRS